MPAKPYYQWLELSTNASQQDIRKAYRKLALKYHPDKHKGHEQRFREIAEAYEVLGNAEKRLQFDRGEVNFDIVFKSSAQVFRECFGDEDEAHPATVVQVVSPQRIFNLPLFNHQSPIVDTRRAELFAQGRIMGSLNLPPGGNVTHFFEEFEAEFCPDDFSEIVLIGHSETDPHTLQVASFIEQLIAHPITDFSDDMSIDLKSFYNKLARSAKKGVLLVAGGVEAFQAAYPGCYGQLSHSECYMTPTHIHGHVFLGTRDFLHGHAREHCMSAGIERAVVPADESYQAAGGSQIRDYFVCDADYQDAESMRCCWEPISRYIDSSPTNVLIILHGRSQSASAVLAWLVHGQPQMELRAAARMMRAKCPSINWSLAFSQLLVEFDNDRKDWLNVHGAVVPAPKVARTE